MSLEEIMLGWDHRDDVKQERGGKLFFLLPRMLLSRPCRGGSGAEKWTMLGELPLRHGMLC